MKNYLEPIVEIKLFTEDVLTTSGTELFDDGVLGNDNGVDAPN